jgi:2-polyprenyl-3-methyl-5-hydroxy-6-metoxy-1,4-benzoquinol methylase
VDKASFCPGCTARDLESFKQWRLSGKQARVWGCRTCGLLFVHPQPRPEELSAYYAPDGGWQASRPEKPSKPAQARKKGAASALFEALDRYLPTTTPPAGARVFDFGCGQGSWLNSFQDHGWETFGLEPSDDSAFIRHRRLDAIPSAAEFDLVLAYHVMEHLPRPLETLQELADAIRPGGHLLVSVPRLDTLAVHRQADYCLHPRHHIVGFTEACLRELMARAGLGVVATFHELDARFSKGEPVRLRMLARKGAAPVPEPDPAASWKPVIDAYVAIREARLSGGPDAVGREKPVDSPA